MKTYKTILVGLECKNSDCLILEHIANMKNALGIQKVFFVHILKDVKLPANSEQKYVKHMTPLVEFRRTLITKYLEDKFIGLNDFDYEILVKDGTPEVEMPKMIQEQQIDLLVLGRKPRPGLTPLLWQLTDTAKCSILIVPKLIRRSSSKNLTPFDFCGSCKQAVNMAYYFRRLGLHKKIAYPYSKDHSLPLGSDITHSVVKGHNTKNYKKNILPENLIANCAVILEKRENLARKIVRYSLSKGANLIMIGYKGSNQLASFLFGSIAIKLAEISYRLPILIDKKRRVNIDILEAFISL